MKNCVKKKVYLTMFKTLNMRSMTIDFIILIVFASKPILWYIIVRFSRTVACILAQYAIIALTNINQFWENMI